MKSLFEFINENVNHISIKNYKDFLNNDGMDQTLKEWYKEKEPWSKTDNISDDSFAVILTNLFNNPKEFSEKYCWGDTTETKWLLEKLAKLCDCDVKYLLNFYKKNK